MSEKNKETVEKVNAAFAENNPDVFLSNCADNAVWNMVGEKTTNGKKAIQEWLAEMKDMEPPKFTVDRIVAEGDSVVCYGDMTMKDKDGMNQSYSYCDIYRFEKDKVTELTSFVIKTEKTGRTATV
jgi:ketosteroid isomerase-like protein